MPYQAMTFRVIATPGDVFEERRLIRNAVSDWDSSPLRKGIDRVAPHRLGNRHDARDWLFEHSPLLTSRSSIRPIF